MGHENTDREPSPDTGLTGHPESKSSTRQQGTAALPSVPWYSLDPRQIQVGRVGRALLAVVAIFLALTSFSVKPLWRWGWRIPIYCCLQMYPVESAAGVTFPAGAWRKSKRILVYAAPDAKPKAADEAAAGLQSLVDELGLAIAVERVPIPVDALRSLKASGWNPSGGPLDFDAFAARRLDDRGGRYAEMLIIDKPFVDPSWAWGLSDYSSGVTALQEAHADHALGRHEGAHLLGYDKHDSFPLFVFGYPDEGWIPEDRNTLMMLLPKESAELSGRARDALLNFWRGMERRDRVWYFRQSYL
jgi:hypothetical protein